MGPSASGRHTAIFILAVHFLLSSWDCKNNHGIIRGAEAKQRRRSSGDNEKNNRRRSGNNQQHRRKQSHQNKQASDPNDYYKILKVSTASSPKEIKSAYRKLALKHHPDKFQPDPKLSEERNERRKQQHNDRFVQVSAAYDVLSDEKKKKAYDKYGQNGLDMLEKGMDPEQAGFGGGFGGFPGGGGGGSSFNGGDAFKMFENMFGGSGGMGGSGFKMGGAGFGGSDFAQQFGGGGGRSGHMGGGFPGFAFGGQGGANRRQPQEVPLVFAKDDPSGVVSLGKAKFPESRAKHAWLLFFYNKEDAQSDTKTKEYVSLTKKLSEGVLKKAKGAKNGMIFKVGAVDCGGEALKFCRAKLGKDVQLPAFATVLNGSVNTVAEGNTRNAKKLHDHTTDSLLQTEGLVVNVNSAQHIESRLLSWSATPNHPSIAILLFTDKYETSPLYASLAYRHRHDGFAAFGESRGSNLRLAKLFSVKKYPTLVALIGNTDNVERYNRASLDSENISKWLDHVSKKYFRPHPRSDSRKKQRARR